MANKTSRSIISGSLLYGKRTSILYEVLYLETLHFHVTTTSIFKSTQNIPIKKISAILLEKYMNHEQKWNLK